MVNQLYFYGFDADFGPFFLKFCTYFPYNAKLCINGHEYVKRQLAKEAIAFEALDNGIPSNISSGHFTTTGSLVRVAMSLLGVVMGMFAILVGCCRAFFCLLMISVRVVVRGLKVVVGSRVMVRTGLLVVLHGRMLVLFGHTVSSGTRKETLRTETSPEWQATFCQVPRNPQMNFP
jgi:hypothetical protein